MPILPSFLFPFIFLLSLTPILCSTTSLQSTASSDASALLSFKAFADPSNHLLFPPLAATPCQWTGVSCSPAGRVTRLVLESLGLNGTFAASSVGRLDQLRILSLKFNYLTGAMPDLSNLTNLKALAAVAPQ